MLAPEEDLAMKSQGQIRRTAERIIDCSNCTHCIEVGETFIEETLSGKDRWGRKWKHVRRLHIRCQFPTTPQSNVVSVEPKKSQWWQEMAA